MENFGLFIFINFFKNNFEINKLFFIFYFLKKGLIEENLKNVNQLYFLNKIMKNYGNQLNSKYLIFQI